MKMIFRETSDLLEWDMTSFKFTKTKIIEKNLMINRNVKLQKKKKPKSKTKIKNKVYKRINKTNKKWKEVKNN